MHFEKSIGPAPKSITWDTRCSHSNKDICPKICYKTVCLNAKFLPSDKVRLYNNALLKFGDVKDSVKKEPAPPLPEEEDTDEWSESIEKHFLWPTEAEL